MTTTLIILAPFVGTIIGAATVLFARHSVSSRIQSSLLGFAAGVMVAASVWSLIIPAIELSADMERMSWLPAAVGIINAINLIDGVNGLSSGFCFMASVLFAIMFYNCSNTIMTTVAISAAGAIIPFFMHNVFGNSTRMFIGDGGTLVIGTMMSMFVINIVNSDSLAGEFAKDNLGLIPFTIAVLSIPVFDTLRVMSMRILRGCSPFNPDKTHLHHMFIELGFSHTGTTVSILTLNFIIVTAWYVSYICGASIDLQLYIVATLSFLVTFVFYAFAKKQIRKQGKTLAFLKRMAKMMNFEKKGIWHTIQRIIDNF